MTTLALLPMGFTWWEAGMAAVVALFTPQLAYNVAKSQHKAVNAA